MAYTLPEPVAETFDIALDNESTATRTFVIPYADIATAASNLNGEAHPTWAGLICRHVSGQPINHTVDGVALTYSKAKITLHYAPPEQGEDSEDLISYSLSLGAESLSFPKEAFAFDAGDGLNEDDPNPHIIVPSMELSITHYHQLSVPLAVVDDLVGKVNDDVYWTFASERVRFDGISSADKTIASDGSDDWTITYTFAIRPPSTGTWNQIYDIDNARWDDLNKTLYEDADFTAFGF